MKKRIILLSMVLILVSGCSVQTLSSTDFEDNMEMILSKDTNLVNVHFDGYQYYVPSGMRFVNKDDYNALLQDKYANRYYLYVDAIGYFHDTKNTYKVDREAYYSKKINYNKKTGYIEINEIEDEYFVEMVFNYCKIEAYVPKKYLISVVNNMSYVLRSVKYHDKVLESLIGENVLNYKEESFNIFESNSNNDESVLKYEDYQEADIKNGENIIDEDNFEVNEIE